MQLIDYTHPDKVPPLHLPLDRRSADCYLRLDELPAGHPFHMPDWAIFRHPEWLEGGSAWVQAKAIADDFERCVERQGVLRTARPVVGSADPDYDEALAQALRTLDLNPLVAEVLPRALVLEMQS